jgi:hypothetical protein
MKNHIGYASDDLRFADILPLLTLNNLHAEQTSFLDERSLAQLLAISCYARGIDHGTTAMLIALDQNAEYDNPNFQWFEVATSDSSTSIGSLSQARRGAGDWLDRSIEISSHGRNWLDSVRLYVRLIFGLQTMCLKPFTGRWDLST